MQRKYVAERWVQYAEHAAFGYGWLFFAFGVLPLALLAAMSPVGREERIGFAILSAAAALGFASIWWLLKQARTRLK